MAQVSYWYYVIFSQKSPDDALIAITLRVA